MKKIRYGILVLMILAMVTPVFAKAKAKPKMAVNKSVIINYQGQTLGKDIPDWVLVMVEGDNGKLEKALKLDNKKTFVVEATGPNLDFLKSWTDLIDVEAEVAGQIERTVAQAIESTMTAQQYGDETEMFRTLDMYAASLKNVTINGLERRASFWIKTQSIKPGLKKAKSADDLIVEYTYYVVYCVDAESFNAQIDEAIADIETNTDQSQMLKEMLTAKIKEKVSVGTATTK